MDDIVSSIKKAINYKDFFSKYLKLKKVGSTYMSLCPFHSDSNPSLSVDLERGLWYCFGCNKGGDVFNFVMEMEGCSFSEAVKFLAEELSLEVPKEESKFRNDVKNIDFEIYKIISEFYHRILKKSSISEKARQYLLNRKIDEEIIDNYKLGYSSKNIENLRIFCKKKGISFEDLQKIGLVYKKGKDFVEILAGRLVIPIISSTGKILGFAGRSVDDSEPKYLNTIGLKKTETLYGINVAKEFIREKRVLILVEGYFDVWALYSLGFKNVCAVMGTSLSNAQIELIRKYSNEVILCFDSDRSGKEAMISLITQLVSNGLHVKVANISNYKDPHELYM
ncbi:MAG: DNA primase, partial [bacterium]